MHLVVALYSSDFRETSCTVLHSSTVLHYLFFSSFFVSGVSLEVRNGLFNLLLIGLCHMLSFAPKSLSSLSVYMTRGVYSILLFYMGAMLFIF